MKKVLFGLAIIISGLAFGQKVKFKKGKVLVDKVETFNYIEEGLMTTLSTLDGKEFCTILSNGYQIPNPDPRTSVNSMLWTPYITRYVRTIRFTGIKNDITSKLYLEDLIKAIISSHILNSNGLIDLEAVDKFAVKYNDENSKLLLGK